MGSTTLSALSGQIGKLTTKGIKGIFRRDEGMEQNTTEDDILIKRMKYVIDNTAND